MGPLTWEHEEKAVRVGLLANPLSGTNRKNPAFLSSLNRKYPAVYLQNAQTPEEIHRALKKLATLNIDILVISGGDGTVQAVLTDLFYHAPFSDIPELVVLAGGTTNMIAVDIGVPKKQEQALESLLAWVNSGYGNISKEKRPIIRLEVPGHGPKYGTFFGTGSISQGTAYYHRNLHINKLSGIPGICMTVLRFLWAFLFQRNQFITPTPIVVHVDNHHLPQENFSILFVSTLEKLLFGFQPFYGTEKGKLKITAVKSKTKKLLQVLPFLLQGKKTKHCTEDNGYISYKANKIDLFLADTVVLDGEMYTPASSEEPIVLKYGGDITFLRIEV